SPLELPSGGPTLLFSLLHLPLLRFLSAYPPHSFPRQELLSMAWGLDFDPRTNLVDVYVGYLRRKLGGPIIETVRGAGYRLRIDRSLPSGRLTPLPGPP